MFKFTPKGIRKILLSILGKSRKKTEKVGRNSNSRDLIEYTWAFARTKQKSWKNPINYNDPDYPRFNNVDYDPEKLMYVYNTAVAARESLASLDGITEVDKMHERINEINGNIYNMIAALGKELRRREEAKDANTTNTTQHGED